MSETEIAGTLAIGRAWASFGAPVAEAEGRELLEVVSDEVSPAPGQRLAHHGLTASVQAALCHLGLREAAVLRRYFGLDGNDPMTLEAIATSFGITREHVRPIRERALARLRKAEQATVLASFYAG